MGVSITDQHLAFMQEAKEAFSRNNTLETYWNKDDFDFIALRFGVDRDCVMVYELGEDIANFVQQMEPKPNPRKEIMNFAYEMETALNHYPILEQKDASYILSSIQNLMDGLMSAQSKHNIQDDERVINMCVNLSAQAMLIAQKFKR